MIVQPRATTKHYDVAGVIGRFQGVQDGHLRVVGKALDVAERVKLMIGSANVARDTRNPFTYHERADMLTACLIAEFGLAKANRVSIAPLDDTPYNKKAWIERVNAEVRRTSAAIRPRICLVGNVRDITSEYLTWFPAWDYVPVEDDGVNATALRKAFFSGNVDFEAKGWSDIGFDWSHVPQPTIEFLHHFRDRSVYAYLMQQLANEAAYRKQWGEGPFLTVDAVILKGDHIAMIERGGPEGTGAKALPGGFHSAGERGLFAAAREAVEETGIFVADEDIPALRGYLEVCKIAQKAKQPAPAMPASMLAAIRKLMSYHVGEGQRFDDPYRSRRAHLITEAFLFQLPDGPGLPRLIGMDDARRAFWVPTSEVYPQDTFEDHAHIADFMISRYAKF